MADRVAVMYAGEVVETARATDLFAKPAHPYTRLLLAAVPTVRRREARLPVIPGQMPAPGERSAGCRFRQRCPVAIARCADEAPGLDALGKARQARCWRAAELLARVAA
jgi:oligopeptide/dipeptide ABC transporter ATP-binding protein